MTYEQLRQEAMEYLSDIFTGDVKEAIPAFVVQAAVTVALSVDPTKE